MEIDSDIGPIQLEIKYEVDYGEPGDYFQPMVHPSVNIYEISIPQHGSLNIANDIKEELEEEILEEERNHEPED